MTALLLVTVGGPWVKSSIAFSANLLVCVVLLCQEKKGRLNNSNSKTQHQVRGRLFWNVVVGQSSSSFKLFSGKDQTLLIWRNSFLVLDLGLDVFDGVRRLHLEGDSLAREGLNENLHLASPC